MATTHRGPDSEVGLNIRWYREGHSIDIGKHVVDAFIGPRSEGFGQFGGAGERASPHADQVGIGVRGQCRRMCLAGPIAGAYDGEAHAHLIPPRISTGIASFGGHLADRRVAWVRPPPADALDDCDRSAAKDRKST